MNTEKFNRLLAADKEIEEIEEFFREMTEFVEDRNSNEKIIDQKYTNAGGLER